jgi:hypothetical protein
MVMPSGQSHKSHFEIDPTRKRKFLSVRAIFARRKGASLLLITSMRRKRPMNLYKKRRCRNVN